MEKVTRLDESPDCSLWDDMWAIRTVEEEVQACELESPPREKFQSYIPKDGKIIDAGCGFGKWVIYLRRRGYDIVGIDSSELAVARVKEFDESINVEPGDILDIKYPDNCFDAYISMGVVEHFEDGPSLALREAYRILKPNGLIFVSVPTVNVIRKVVRQPIRNALHGLSGVPKGLIALAGRLGHRQPFLAETEGSRRRNEKYRHFLEYRYSRGELEAFLREAGFDIAETVPHDFYGSRDHAVGLVSDFSFLGVRGASNFRLNLLGRAVARTFNRLSPWIACSSVLCVARAEKH